MEIHIGGKSALYGNGFNRRKHTTQYKAKKGTKDCMEILYCRQAVLILFLKELHLGIQGINLKAEQVFCNQRQKITTLS